jgi:hypothetical protein
MADPKPLREGVKLIAGDGTRFAVVAVYPESKRLASMTVVRGEMSGAELTIPTAKAEKMERA